MFSSSWTNPQQNQQQQQQPSAFGQQPSAFGGATNNAFGSTSAFGQPQQQQPQVNPMFGNISSTPSANTGTTGGGFGAFGGNNNAATTSAFGAKPAGGFGAFGGGTSAFGGGTGTAFGQPANNAAPTTSVFGQPAATTTTSAFGGGSSLFGAGKSNFGTSSLAGATASIPVVTTGTSNPPYNITNEKDGNVNLQFQSISCMPAYVGYSFEELRVQDYAQNRKAASTTGAFGGASAFGTPQPATTSVFGAQPAQQPTTSLFGGGNTNTTNNAFGAFGQTNPQPAATNTTSIFGGGGAFGQTPQQQQPSAFGGATGAFGQPQQQQQQQPTSLFGAATNTTAFGSAAPKPAFGTFGGGTTTNAFGAGTSAFGNPQQQQTQQPAQATGLFGTAPANNTSTFGGAFGNNAAKPSIFGTTTAAQPATTNPFGGGAFGNTQQQQQQPQQQTSLFGGGTTGASLFGNNQQQGQQQPQTNSIFGGQQQQQPAAPSLFGNTGTAGTSLFGNTQQNQQQQQPAQQNANPFGNLFGTKPAQPAAPSLFGGQTQTQQQPQQQTSLFGNTFGQPAQNSSLFGNKPAAPLLGNSLSGSMGMNTSLFGASTQNAGAQGTLTASIAQPIGENLPIFAMLPPGPRILDLEQNMPKKKAGFFLDMPTRSPVPRVQLGFTPANSKLRGFGSSSSLMSSNAGINGSVSFAAGKPGALALNKSDARASSVGPDFLGRSGSPALGSGGRQSVKKVIMDKKVEPGELFVKSGSPGGLKAGKVTFSPALSVASREKDAQLAAAAAASQVVESPTPASRTQPQRSTSGFGTKNAKALAVTDADDSSSTELGEGDYWVKPDLPTLKKAGYDQLSSFEGLVVGRKGYGEIHFLEPVDLTGLPKLGALLGDVVRFDDKECSVYPDSDEADKPPPGSGLNVKAKLCLERCWAVDKASREPIKDVNHPHAVKHLKRLKNMKDTHFEGFDMKTGTWTFTVDHF